MNKLLKAMVASDSHLAIAMQPFDAIEQNIEGSREYACTTCVGPSLDSIGFARIGDSISEQ
jgi:hypothetical protein